MVSYEDVGVYFYLGVWKGFVFLKIRFMFICWEFGCWLYILILKVFRRFEKSVLVVGVSVCV